MPYFDEFVSKLSINPIKNDEYQHPLQLID